MQISKQIFNFQQAFYCWFISRILVMAYKKNNYCSKQIFAMQAALQRRLSVVNSILLRKRGQSCVCAANLRVLDLCFLEQRPKTTYMFLQYLLSCFQNLYPATEKRNHLVQKCVKTVTLPSNGDKNFVQGGKVQKFKANRAG